MVRYSEVDTNTVKMQIKVQDKKRKFLTITAYFLAVLGLVVLVVGIVMFSKDKSCPEKSETNRTETGTDNSTTGAQLNAEAQKLVDLITKVKETYYKSYPHTMAYDPDVDLSNIIDNFNPYDPRPMAIKNRTDTAMRLRAELDNLKLDKTKLKPRERKAAAQLAHYLDSIFGHPYEENYYAGDWMMGPNYFCWQPICVIGSAIRAHFNPDAFQPKSMDDVTKIINHLKKHENSITQYQENMMYGVRAGMVRAVEDCRAGRNAFKTRFRKIADMGPNGVLSESFASHLINPTYFSKIPEADKSAWLKKNGKSIEQSVKDFLVKHMGERISNLIHFLDNTYSRYCVPSSVTSGLGNLPLDYVWVDQKENRSLPTTKKLPTGEELDGKKSYELILPYFTTSKEYTAEKINQMGMERKTMLFERALEIAKKITKLDNTNDAESKFKSDLNDNSMFFNKTVIPDNENGEVGAKRCFDMASAKKNCPVRYEAMQTWFKFVQSILAKIEPKTIGMFYMTGDRMTAPNCPVKMVAKFNPSSGSQSYNKAGSRCLTPAHYNLPFFLTRPGPIYNAFSVAGHEARPGHHTQVQGFAEHFFTSGANDVIDWLNFNNYYTAFTEGWALYAENPLLATETDLYKDNPLQEYGMIKWQIWRALRLIIDTGLHHRNMTMQESLDLFEKYAWDKTDKSYKDTIRYMSDPGQSTAYMIGQLAIWSMRNQTEAKFKDAKIPFNEQEFHYQILSQGSSPLAYLQEHIDGYIDCKINKNSRSDCEEIINPKTATKAEKIGSEARWKWLMENVHGHERYD